MGIMGTSVTRQDILDLMGPKFTLKRARLFKASFTALAESSSKNHNHGHVKLMPLWARNCLQDIGKDTSVTGHEWECLEEALKLTADGNPSMLSSMFIEYGVSKTKRWVTVVD